MSAVTVAETEAASAFDDRVAICADTVIAAVQKDYSLRVPKGETERRTGFADWLADCRDKYRPLIAQAWADADKSQSSPAVFSFSPQESYSRLVENEVWQRVETYLLSLAMRYYATGWMLKRFGDAMTLTWPEYNGRYWITKIGNLAYGDGLGQLALDANGTVIEELSTTPADVKRELNDRVALSLPAAHAE